MIFLQEAIAAGFITVNFFIVFMILGVPFLSRYFFIKFKRKEQAGGKQKLFNPGFFELIAVIILSVIILTGVFLLLIYILSFATGPLD